MKTPILPYALFDMDGTLVDSMGYWREMPLEYLAEVGIRPDAEGLQHLTSARGYGEIIAYFASLGIHTTLPEMLRFVATHIARHYAEEVQVKPGVPALLESLRAAGCRMGVVTLTPHAGTSVCLTKTGLAPYFDFVLTPEDMPGGGGKEEPGIFEEALRRLGEKGGGIRAPVFRQILQQQRHRRPGQTNFLPHPPQGGQYIGQRVPLAAAFRQPGSLNKKAPRQDTGASQQFQHGSSSTW